MKLIIIFLVAFNFASTEAAKTSDNEDSTTENNYQATLKNEGENGFCKASGFYRLDLSFLPLKNSPEDGNSLRILGRGLL